MTKVTLGRDFGTQIEAITGLKVGDPLVINPGDDVVNGVTVRIVRPRTAPISADTRSVPRVKALTHLVNRVATSTRNRK